MLENNYVYLHTRNTDDIVFYVGIGVANRAWAKSDRNPHWHHTVKKHGYSVSLIHEGLTRAEAAQKEIELIAYYRQISGKSLVNITAGGDGGMLGYNHTEESKEKIVKALIGNKYAVGNTSFKGKTHSEEARKKIKEKRALQAPTFLGKNHSEEIKAIIKEKRAKQVMTEETKSKIRAAMKGKKKSPEHIAKVTAANTGKQRSEDIKKRMCDAQSKVPRKGKPVHTVESRYKLRQAANLRNKNKSLTN